MSSKVFTVAVALSLACATAAFAQTNQIPYQGHLDRDGVAMNGKFNFKFELYSDLSKGDCAATPKPAECLWSDEYLGVEVKGGRFSVALGSNAPAPLADTVWTTNDQVFLAIKVAQAGDPYSALAGRQRILAVPMAARASAAKNYNVTGTLTVGGSLSTGGAATVGQSLTVGGSITGNDTTVNGDLRLPNGKFFDRGHDVSCPNASRGLYGQCWWEEMGPFTLRSAATACLAKNAHLCTSAELAPLFWAGVGTCSWGWSGDWVSAGSGRIVTMSQTASAGCGAAGLLFQDKWETDLFPAYCCK